MGLHRPARASCARPYAVVFVSQPGPMVTISGAERELGDEVSETRLPCGMVSESTGCGTISGRAGMAAAWRLAALKRRQFPRGVVQLQERACSRL